MLWLDSDYPTSKDPWQRVKVPYENARAPHMRVACKDTSQSQVKGTTC